MKTSWVKGLVGEKKAAMSAAFSSSGEIRERLTKLIEEKIDTIRKERMSDSSYDSPNWAYKQADLCGYERAMKEIISLIL